MGILCRYYYSTMFRRLCAFAVLHIIVNDKVNESFQNTIKDRLKYLRVKTILGIARQKYKYMILEREEKRSSRGETLEAQERLNMSQVT